MKTRFYRYNPSPLVLAEVAYIFVLLAYLESKKILDLRGKKYCGRFSRGSCG